MREIILDTETTGLDPLQGHKIVEIGCVEMIDKTVTGNHFQCHINPERDMPEEAFKVHGLSQEFLQDKPIFADIADDLLAFLKQDQLIIHNAEFDLKFLNYEFEAIGYDGLQSLSCVDTVSLARQKLPNQRVNLDALCVHYNIDATARTVHGALLDAQLLAEVYIELSGGRQKGFSLELKDDELYDKNIDDKSHIYDNAIVIHATDAEIQAHQALCKKLSRNLWYHEL